MLKAKRDIIEENGKIKQHQHLVTLYKSYCYEESWKRLKQEEGKQQFYQTHCYHFIEDTEQVDGIGGIVWEGSLVLSHFLEVLEHYSTLPSSDNSRLHYLELGAGNGLLGLLLYNLGFSVTITDRFIDLIQNNAKIHENIYLQNLTESQLQQSLQSMYLNEGKSPDRGNNKRLNILPLDWEKDQNKINLLFSENLIPDILLGAEITCLKKQHPHLLPTLQKFSLLNPNLIILLTFDDIPCKLLPKSNYENEFIQSMKRLFFYSAIVFTGNIEWKKDRTNHSKQAYLTDLTLDYDHDLDWLSIPNNLYLSTHRSFSGSIKRRKSSHDIDAKDSKEDTESDVIESNYHHVIAFFRSTAINTCSRCQKQFFHTPFFHANNICCYHSGYYVCRKHPGETKLSIDGQGDSLGYYGNGRENWEAKFWDCCGSEDINELGCCKGYHSLY